MCDLDSVEQELRDSLISPTIEGQVLLSASVALTAAEEIASLRAERLTLAELVEAYALEGAPEALAEVARDRDNWWKRAVRPLRADLALAEAEAEEQRAEAAYAEILARLGSADNMAVTDILELQIDHRSAESAVSAALKVRQAATAAVLQQSRERAELHYLETSDV